MLLRKPTVLILEGSERIGGGQRVTLEAVRALADDFTFIAAVPREGSLKHAFEQQGVETVILGYPAPAWKFSVLDRVSYMPRGLAAMPSIRRLASRAALVYATSRTGLWAAFSGAPAVMHLHLIPPTNRTAAYLRWLSHRRGIRSIAVASGAISSAARLPDDRTVVIPNGVDASLFRPDDMAGKEIRAGLKIKRSTFVIGIAAELAPEKGQLDAVRAVASLHAAGVDSALLLAGSARRGQESYASEVASTASAMGLADHFRLLGYRTDMPAVMNAFDLLAVPSKGPSGEACPVSVLEAWACGVPVVGSNAGGLAGLLADGRGLTFTPGDVSGLAAAVRAVVTDKGLRGSMKAAGLAAAKSDYSIAAFATRMRSFFRAALGA
jgi:glycosyltransferase involved in cell wall biosynthesis